MSNFMLKYNTGAIAHWGKDITHAGAASTPSGTDEGTENQVTTSSNRIYFYSEVTRTECLSLNKNIQEIANSMVTTSQSYGIPPPPVKLHINSYGGSVFAGLSTVDTIISAPAPVHSIVEGCAASAATMMSVVATERYIRENSYMLIHQLSSGMWGKYEELKDDMKNSDTLMGRIKLIYERHAKIPKKQLSDILKHDLWFDAKTCLKYGLVDDILGAPNSDIK